MNRRIGVLAALGLLVAFLVWSCGGGGGSDRAPAQDGLTDAVSPGSSTGDTGDNPVYQVDELSGRMQRIFESPVWDEPDTEVSRPEPTELPGDELRAKIDEATREWIESGASLNPHEGEVEGRRVSLLDPHAPFSPGSAQTHDECGVVSGGEVIQTGDYGAGRYLERDINDLGSASDGESICATYDSIARISGNDDVANQWYPDFTEALAERYAQQPQTEQSVPFGFNGDGDEFEDKLESGPSVAGDPIFNHGFAFEFNPEHPSGVTLWDEFGDVNPEDFAVAHHFDASGVRGIWGYLVSSSSSDPRSGGDADYGSSPGRWYDQGSPGDAAISPHYMLGGAAYVPARQVFSRAFNNNIDDSLNTDFYWADVMPAPAGNTQSATEDYELQEGSTGTLDLRVTEMYSYASTEYQRSRGPSPAATDWIISITGIDESVNSWPDPAFEQFLNDGSLPGSISTPGGSRIAFPVPGVIGDAYELHAKWSQSDPGAQPWQSTLGPPTSPPILEGESILDPNRINDSNELVAYTQITQEFMQGLIRARIYDQGPSSVEIFRYTGTTVKAGNGRFERSPMMQTGEDTFAPILMGGHDGSFPLSVRLVANSSIGTDRLGQVEAIGQSGTGTAGVTFVAIPAGGGSETNRDPITDLVLNHGDGTARFNDRTSEDWEDFQVTSYAYTDGNVARGNAHPQVLVLQDPDGNGDPEPILSGPQERNYAVDSGPRVKLSGTQEVQGSPISIVTPFPINDSETSDNSGDGSSPLVSKSAVGDLANALQTRFDFDPWPDSPVGVGYSEADREACSNTGDYADSSGFNCTTLWSEIQSHGRIFEFVSTPSGGTFELDNDGLASSSGREPFTDALLNSRLIIVQYPHNVSSSGIGPSNNTLLDNFEGQLKQYLALPGQRSVILMGDGNLQADLRHSEFADFGDSRVGAVSPPFLRDWAGVATPAGSQTALGRGTGSTESWGNLLDYGLSGNFLNARGPALNAGSTTMYYDWKDNGDGSGGGFTGGITPIPKRWDRFDHILYSEASGGFIFFGGINTPFRPETNKPRGQIRVGYFELALINTHLPTFSDADDSSNGTDDEDVNDFYSAVTYDLRLADPARPNEQVKKADYLERIVRATDRNITATGAGTEYIPDTTTRNPLGDPDNHLDPETINTTVQITGTYAELVNNTGGSVNVDKGSGRSLSTEENDHDQLVEATINPADDPSQATVFYEIAYRSDAELALDGGLDDPSRVAYRFDVTGNGSFDLPGGQLGQPMRLGSPTLKVRYTNAVLGNVDRDGDGFLDWEPRPDEDDESTWVDSDGDGRAGERDVGLGAPAFVRGQVLVSTDILTGFDDADSGSPFSAGTDSGDFWGDDPEAEHNADGNPRSPGDFGLSADDTLVDNDDVCVEIMNDGSRASDPTAADWCVFYRMNEGSGEGQNEAWLEYNPVGTFDGQSSYTGDGSSNYLSVHPNTDDCLRYRVSDPGNDGDDGDPVPAAISNLDGDCANAAVTLKDTDYLAGALISVESDLLPLNLSPIGPGPGGDVAQEEFNPDPEEGPDPNDDYGEEITVEWSVSGGIGPYDIEFREQGPGGRVIATEPGVSAGTGSHTFLTAQESVVGSAECTDPGTNVLCEGDYTIFAEATDSQTPTPESSFANWDWQNGDFSVQLPIVQAIVINDTSSTADNSGASGNAEVDALVNELGSIFGDNPDVRNTDNNSGSPITGPGDFNNARRVFWAVDYSEQSAFSSDEKSALNTYIGNGHSFYLFAPYYDSMDTAAFCPSADTALFEDYPAPTPVNPYVFADQNYDYQDSGSIAGDLGNPTDHGAEGWAAWTGNFDTFSFFFTYDPVDPPWNDGLPLGGGWINTSSVYAPQGSGSCALNGQALYNSWGTGSTGAGASGNYRRDALHNMIEESDSIVGFGTPAP